MASVAKRMIQLGARSGAQFSKSGAFGGGSWINGMGASGNSYRWLSTNSAGNQLNKGWLEGNPNYASDNLHLFNRLRAGGVHPDAMAWALSDTYRQSLKANSKEELEKIISANVAKYSKDKTEVISPQDHQFSLLVREIEELQNEVVIIREQLRRITESAEANEELALGVFGSWGRGGRSLKYMSWMIPLVACWIPISNLRKRHIK